MSFSFSHPYKIHPDYEKKVAYFCMEYGIHQPLKIYAGGLGFLAGSHIRSAFELKQNLVGIGILWKYGYYDQVRKQDQTMDVLFQEKGYGFLVDTQIKFTIQISHHDVWVAAWYLPPDTFNTAPLFLLSTDLPENDYPAKTISHKLYDANPETRIAASILLGAGGAKLLEALNWEPDIYHLNESHGLPLAFYLYKNYKHLDEVKKRLVFTNHTPEEAGNQKSNIRLLEKMNFFCDTPVTEVLPITHTIDENLDYTITAVSLSKKVNAVSKMHLETMQRIWSQKSALGHVISITNAQNYAYWHDEEMYVALNANDDKTLIEKKRQGKQFLFELVADQCGEIYDEKIITIVFAKRFAGYKRAELLIHDMERFHRLVTNTQQPVQIIWAGKPYPMDYAAIGVFDRIVDICRQYTNCSILTGYEIKMAKVLKQGADIWLNIPRVTHEACGTSGMAATMNGAVNVGLPDGWYPEFAKDKTNCFVVPSGDLSLPAYLQDDNDAASLFNLLEMEVLPMYYDHHDCWMEIVKNGMRDIVPQFNSNRMAKEYYERLYRD